tara:strand:+ start:204 stop:488 length:285 start_codon:yes stop_codon:yes gene_type:complete
MIVMLFGKLSIIYLVIVKKSYVPSSRYFNSAVNEKKISSEVNTIKLTSKPYKNLFSKYKNIIISFFWVLPHYHVYKYNKLSRQQKRAATTDQKN